MDTSLVSIQKFSYTVMPDLRSLSRTAMRGHPGAFEKAGFPADICGK
jgi:hypothetical protein